MDFLRDLGISNMAVADLRAGGCRPWSQQPEQVKRIFRASYKDAHGNSTGLKNADNKVLNFECVKCHHKFKTGQDYEHFDPLNDGPKCPKCGGENLLYNNKGLSELQCSSAHGSAVGPVVASLRG